MSSIEIPKALSQSFAKLLQKYEAMIPAASLREFYLHPFAKLDYYFDLDKIWANPNGLKEAVDVLAQVLQLIDRHSPFDAIVPILSAIGSIGPLPEAAILAERLQKGLVIFKEVEFGQHLKYPSTASISDLLGNRRVLVMKDIVVRANTMKEACEFLSRNGIVVSAAFVIVHVETHLRPPLPIYLGEAISGKDLTVVSLLEASEIHMELKES